MGINFCNFQKALSYMRTLPPKIKNFKNCIRKT